MTEKLDPTAVALRRSPFVRQEVQVEPATGCFYGIVDGKVNFWGPDATHGSGDAERDLIPLQTKREPLRCFAMINREGDLVLSRTQHHSDWRPMIEATELDRVRAAGDALADGWEEDYTGVERLDALVAAWREAVK